MNQPTEAPERLLSPPVVLDRTSLSRTTLWRLVRRNEFPPSVTLSPGRVAWPESQVNAWIAAKLSKVVGVAQ